jgi:hypothetical protein
LISAPDRPTSAEAPLAFRLPKRGASTTEYEDAVAWSRRAPRYAVADGASASAFARLWAFLLVHAYTAGRLRAEQLEDDLAPVQARWAAVVGRRRLLPWYALEQVRRGAFAALAGLSLEDDGRWTALAVGDCCVFQVRDDALVAAFPLQSPEAFARQPLLLCSRPAANASLRATGGIGTATGTWLPGDTFLLMSDALAATFLERIHTESVPPLATLNFVPTPAGFRAWVADLRTRRRLRNDDVSLLWIPVAAHATA